MRKLGLLLAPLAASLSCSGSLRLPAAAAGPAVLELRGGVKGAPYRLGTSDLERLPRRGLKGADRGGQVARWEGVSLAALADQLELLRGTDTVIVRTAARAAVPIPLAVIRSLRPVLADKRDGAPLAALEVAWPTEDQQGLATDPRAAAWWAKGVVALELVEWQRAVAPALATGEGASDAARRGAGSFAESCLACHRLRATGGGTGPDLTAAAARMTEEAFTALVPGHPGWRDRPAPAHDRIQDLWAFLRTVAATPLPDPDLAPTR